MTRKKKMINVKKAHTNKCRWEATKGGFVMFFVSIAIGLLSQQVPHHVHVEPVKVKHISDKTSLLFVSSTGRKSLY